ncbi:alginate export family protein [Microbulbifer bruguierae]|uniref:Alginate export family protein n=1 Tax=Microbulbifer bruguierae TaxID=3029061 RepID=A0ABY8NDM3_9GAMM|nr:alginate export family protein [Microbulbifer bruguierae]WGL17001.1 alginate export family protein [Microbulbifer bruguierae]
MHRTAYQLLAAPLFTLTVNVAAAELPPIQKLRFNEDYSALLTQSRSTCWPEYWKAIPLQNGAGGYLNIGGEILQRYEYTDSPVFGQDPQDRHGVWFQRYAILADLRWSSHLRLFAQLNSALESGRRGGPSPVDENKLEWQNLFVDFDIATSNNGTLTLRPGRQEIVLGSGRLVDVREGPNVRRTFDGGRILFADNRWRLELFAVRPREDHAGIFDDSTSDRYSLWGAYGTIRQPFETVGDLDLYYLGYRDTDALYVQGSGRERRQSFGARYWGEHGSWNWNWESLIQTGIFASGDIAAWTLATETGYRFEHFAWKPELRFSINIASGDDDLDDTDLGTFNPLFPRGNYFSEAAVFGPRNFYNVHTFLNLLPNADWSLTADLNLFWRLETADGLYSPSGQIVRYPNGSTAHFAVTTLSLTAEYSPVRGLVFTATHTFGKPEAFLEETGTHEFLNFTELTMQYRF